MIEKINFQTQDSQQIVDLRKEVNQVLEGSGVQEGLCYIYSPHTTASLIVTSYFEDTQLDIFQEVNRIIPIRPDFVHQWDPPTDAAGHVKTALFGVSQFFLIHEGQIVLGHAQGILFYEFDGPRDREVFVKIVPDVS